MNSFKILKSESAGLLCSIMLSAIETKCSLNRFDTSSAEVYLVPFFSNVVTLLTSCLFITALSAERVDLLK